MEVNNHSINLDSINYTYLGFISVVNVNTVDVPVDLQCLQIIREISIVFFFGLILLIIRKCQMVKAITALEVPVPLMVIGCSRTMLLAELKTSLCGRVELTPQLVLLIIVIFNTSTNQTYTERH